MVHVDFAMVAVYFVVQASNYRRLHRAWPPFLASSSHAELMPPCDDVETSQGNQ